MGYNTLLGRAARSEIRTYGQATPTITEKIHGLSCTRIHHPRLPGLPDEPLPQLASLTALRPCVYISPAASTRANDTPPVSRETSAPSAYQPILWVRLRA